MQEYKKIEGDFAVRGARFGIVASRFNDFITGRLIEGSLDTLARHGVARADAEVVWVPGAFELPLAARIMASSGKYDAVIALGAVIRGATPHFDYVAGQCAAGLARVALDAELPVAFGVLTVDTIEQAIERAGTKAGNKGVDAAMTAIEMVNLVRRLKS